MSLVHWQLGDVTTSPIYVAGGHRTLVVIVVVGGKVSPAHALTLPNWRGQNASPADVRSQLAALTYIGVHLPSASTANQPPLKPGQVKLIHPDQ